MTKKKIILAFMIILILTFLVISCKPATEPVSEKKLEGSTATANVQLRVAPKESKSTADVTIIVEEKK